MLILLLILAPFGTGLLINRYVDEENRGIGVTYAAGFLTLLAVFQLITVPVVFTDPWGFERVVELFNVATTLLTGMGIIGTMHYWRREGWIFHKNAKKKERSKLEQMQWILVFLLIGLQLFMAVTHASFDGDDAYYVVQSVITDETNTLYRILPYTGTSTSLDMRHSMAVFPIWIAYIARMTGVHATIVSHTLLPVFLIPLTYIIYYEIGRKLFREKAEQLPSYMILVCTLQIFGNVSIYNNATFLLMRTWQGKSMLANVVIPGIFMILLWLFDGEPEKRPPRGSIWFLLFMINIVAAMMSTASVFLNSFLIAVMAIIFSLQEKNIKILFKMAACCIPCVVYALLYILL